MCHNQDTTTPLLKFYASAAAPSRSYRAAAPAAPSAVGPKRSTDEVSKDRLWCAPPCSSLPRARPRTIPHMSLSFRGSPSRKMRYRCSHSRYGFSIANGNSRLRTAFHPFSSFASVAVRRIFFRRPLPGDGTRYRVPVRPRFYEFSFEPLPWPIEDRPRLPWI